MKTLKYLKRAKTCFVVFVFCGFLSSLAFFLHSRTWNDLFLGVGLFSMAGWFVNPFPMIFSIVGIGHYLPERRDVQMRSTIGKRWMLFPAIIFGSVLVFMSVCCLTVVLTGGV